MVDQYRIRRLCEPVAQDELNEARERGWEPHTILMDSDGRIVVVFEAVAMSGSFRKDEPLKQHAANDDPLANDLSDKEG